MKIYTVYWDYVFLWQQALIYFNGPYIVLIQYHLYDMTEQVHKYIIILHSISSSGHMTGMSLLFPTILYIILHVHVLYVHWYVYVIIIIHVHVCHYNYTCTCK